jgi:hypothetical protein
MRISDRLSIAAWTGMLFGLLGGLVLCICRLYPAVLAPFQSHDRGLRAAAWNGHHYIQDSRPGGGEELYDLSSDPLERDNLAREKRLTVFFRELMKERLGGPEIAAASAGSIGHRLN